MRTSTASRTLDLRLRRGHGRPQQGQAVGGASELVAGGVPQRLDRHARQKLCSHAKSTGSSKGPPQSGHVASCSRRSTSPGTSSGASIGSQRLGDVPSATTATAFECADGRRRLLLAESMNLLQPPALTCWLFYVPSWDCLSLQLASVSTNLPTTSGFIGREEAPPGSKHQACVTLRLVLQLRKVWGGEWEEGPRNEEMLTRGRSGAKVASVGR